MTFYDNNFLLSVLYFSLRVGPISCLNILMKVSFLNYNFILYYFVCQIRRILLIAFNNKCQFLHNVLMNNEGFEFEFDLITLQND